MSDRDGHEWSLIEDNVLHECDESECYETAKWRKTLIACDKSYYDGGQYCHKHSVEDGNLMVQSYCEDDSDAEASCKGKIKLDAMLTPREQWMIAKAISGVVSAYNAAHCSQHGEKEAVNQDPNYVMRVAAHVADFCDMDHMAIEDMIVMLELSLKVCEKGAVYTGENGAWTV